MSLRCLTVVDVCDMSPVTRQSEREVNYAISKLERRVDTVRRFVGSTEEYGPKNMILIFLTRLKLGSDWQIWCADKRLLAMLILIVLTVI